MIHRGLAYSRSDIGIVGVVSSMTMCKIMPLSEIDNCRTVSLPLNLSALLGLPGFPMQLEACMYFPLCTLIQNCGLGTKYYISPNLHSNHQSTRKNKLLISDFILDLVIYFE